MCTNCNQRSPNPGRKWCQQCFVSSGGNQGAGGKGGQMCVKCNQRSPNPGFKWCQQCFAPNSPGSASGPITLKPVDQAKFQSIESQFQVGMQKKGVSVSIMAIYSVWFPSRNRDYESYKSKIAAANGGKANEKRWWHGSHLSCDLITSKSLCKGSSCSICSILSKGFLLQTAGKNFGWTRFGPGLYFAPDAAKSNDYVKGHNGINCMILCKVVVGRPKIFYDSQPLLTSVPSGYDSILGEVGSVLNYPELVLYDEDAVLPSYVVFYH